MRRCRIFRVRNWPEGQQTRKSVHLIWPGLEACLTQSRPILLLPGDNISALLAWYLCMYLIMYRLYRELQVNI